MGLPAEGELRFNAPVLEGLLLQAGASRALRVWAGYGLRQRSRRGGPDPGASPPLEQEAALPYFGPSMRFFIISPSLMNILKYPLTDGSWSNWYDVGFGC